MIKTSIYKPITMLMVLLTVVVFGLYTYRMMSVNMLPDFTIPVVTAVVVYPGASPEELESTVIKPIEDQVELIDGIDYMTAYALENYAIFVMIFTMDVSVDVAANDVREKIEAVQLQFPDAVEDAVIQKVDINAQSIVDFALTAPVDQTELRTFAENYVNPKLSSVPGVASVDIFGGTEREISIELNKEAMVSRNVDIATIMGIVGQSNLTNPFGDIQGDLKNTSIRMDAKFKSVDEISSLLIPTATGAIRLHRSEEHTSELQSRPHLVCRLLLEKKKIKDKQAFDGTERKLSHRRALAQTRTVIQHPFQHGFAEIVFVE